jgi:hypothetical protein
VITHVTAGMSSSALISKCNLCDELLGVSPRVAEYNFQHCFIYMHYLHYIVWESYAENYKTKFILVHTGSPLTFANILVLSNVSKNVTKLDMIELL